MLCGRCIYSPPVSGRNPRAIDTMREFLESKMTAHEDARIEHTPGPWDFDGVCQIFERERPHMRICFLPSDHARYYSSKPNGQLIAAAPDYAAAVQKMIDCEHNSSDGWREGWNALKLAHTKAGYKLGRSDKIREP